MSLTKDRMSFPLRVLDHASSMMAYWDRELVCCYANRVYEKWFGKPGAQLVGTTLPELLGPELFALNRPYILGALDGRPQEFERTILGPDGIARHSLARYHPDITDGIVMGFVAEVADVGPLKQLEATLQNQIALKRRMMAELERKEAALDMAQQLGQIGSWHWEIESDICTWSSGMYRLFGYNPAQLPPTFSGQSRLYTPESWATLQSAVQVALERGEPYMLVLEYTAPDGTASWLEARGEAEFDSHGAIVGLHGTAQDITRRSRLLKALQDQTHRLELALDAAHVGMWHWDADTDLLTLENPLAAAILGVEPDAPKAMAASTFFDALWHAECQEAFREAAARFFDHGEPHFYFRGRFYRSNGQLRWMECTGARIGHAQSRAMIGAFFDISERIATKQALQDTVNELKENDARKAELLTTLGHELRNCITPLSSGVRLMHLKPAGADTRQIEAIMRRQLVHIGRLVDDIFDLRRLQCDELLIKREQVSLNAVVASAVTMCEDAIAQAGHQLTVEMAQQDMTMDGDFVRLTQVVTNLLTNACKFTPQHGRIALTVRTDGTDHYILSVRDSGIGIAADALDRIFGLYVQIHHDQAAPNAGLGIGLHLVKKLVERHGGTITATSEGPGAGCTFTVRLPKHAPR